MTRGEANRYVAALAGATVLAGPRRTRPLAGFLYGLALSRAQGSSRDRLERTMLRLFDERTSAIAAIRAAHQRIDDTRRRLDDAETVLAVHGPPADMARGGARGALQRIRDRRDVIDQDGAAASSGGGS